MRAPCRAYMATMQPLWAMIRRCGHHALHIERDAIGHRFSDERAPVQQRHRTLGEAMAKGGTVPAILIRDTMPYTMPRNPSSSDASPM